MKNIRTILFVILVCACHIYVGAQETQTLYFLENAPTRHLLNPAFQPVGKVYVGITPFNYMSMSAGNNTLALSDILYKKDGRYITALYPGEGDKLKKLLRNDLRSTADLDFSLLNFGFRIKDYGYFHFGIRERFNSTVVMPGKIYDFINSSNRSDDAVAQYDLSALSMNVNFYTEFAAGYSHIINEQWSVGGKLKFLYGHAFADYRSTDFSIRTTPFELQTNINGNMQAAIPMLNNVPTKFNKETFANINDFFEFTAAAALKPQGYGGAIDIGATYKSLAVIDLGFIHWKSNGIAITGDSVYTGPVMQYRDINSNTADETNNGLGAVFDTIGVYMLDFLQNSLNAQTTGNKGANRMLNTKINIGVDANFWDNRVGVGIYSSTQFRGSRVYEEVTLGAALRPVNWFNFALSYSFVNGKWSSLGLGLSFMPYDGLNFLFMTDYIPMSYADLSLGKSSVTVPYKMQGMNIGFGVSIVVGTNKGKDE